MQEDDDEAGFIEGFQRHMFFYHSQTCYYDLLFSSTPLPMSSTSPAPAPM
jgi:hypothetical protein